MFIFLCVIFFVVMLALAYKMAHSEGIEAKKFARNVDGVNAKILDINVSGFITLKRFEFPVFRRFKTCGYGVSKLDVNPWINPTYSLFYFNNYIYKKNIIFSNYDSRDIFYIKNYEKYSSGGVFCTEAGFDSVVSIFKEKFSGVSVFFEISQGGLLFGFRTPAKNDTDRNAMFVMCESFIKDFNSGVLSR